MYSVNEDGIILYDGVEMRCSWCGHYITKDDLEDELPENYTDDDFHFWKDSMDKIYCSNCNEDLVCCEDCGDVVRRDYATWVGSRDGYICDNCLSNNYFCCEDCEEYYPDGSTTTIEMYNDEIRTVCDNCYEHYYQCVECGRYVDEDNAYSDDDGNTLCPNCHSEGGNRRMGIRGYHYTSVPGYGMDFLGVENRTFKPMLGVELEVESRNGSSFSKRNTDADDVREIIGENRVVCCSDGSLCDGFEIISCPAALSYHKDTLKWEDGLKKLIELNYRSHDGGHCGLHVHIDRQYFGTQSKDDVEAKFFITFRNNMEWIKLFSRRNNYSYCRPNGYDDSEVQKISKFVAPPDKAWIKNKKQGDRYCALNFHPRDTIEVRIFRGTLKYESFMATLEFVSLWAYIVKQFDAGNICSVDLNTFKAFAEMREMKYFLEYVKNKVEVHYRTVDENGDQ